PGTETPIPHCAHASWTNLRLGTPALPRFVSRAGGEANAYGNAVETSAAPRVPDGTLIAYGPRDKTCYPDGRGDVAVSPQGRSLFQPRRHPRPPGTGPRPSRAGRRRGRRLSGRAADRAGLAGDGARARSGARRPRAGEVRGRGGGGPGAGRPVPHGLLRRRRL